MDRRLAVVGAILLGGGGAAITLALTRKQLVSPGPQDRAAAAIAQLDGEIKTARGAIHERASTLAQLLGVRTAIATDAATTRDMVASGELALAPRPAETLELGRIMAGSSTVEELFVEPAGGRRTTYRGHASVEVALSDRDLVITEVVKIDPVAHADQIDGFLSVARVVDLGPSIAIFGEAGISGKLVVAGRELSIGTIPPAPTFRPVPLAAQDGVVFALAEVPREVVSTPVLVGGIVSSGLGLVVFVLGVSSRRLLIRA